MIIRNHQTGDKAVVVFSPYSKVGSKYRHIAGQYIGISYTALCFTCDSVGEVFDPSGKVKFHIFGTWDEKIHRDAVSGEFVPVSVGCCLYIMQHQVILIHSHYGKLIHQFPELRNNLASLHFPYHLIN